MTTTENQDQLEDDTCSSCNGDGLTEYCPRCCGRQFQPLEVECGLCKWFAKCGGRTDEEDS